MSCENHLMGFLKRQLLQRIQEQKLIVWMLRCLRFLYCKNNILDVSFTCQLFSFSSEEIDQEKPSNPTTSFVQWYFIFIGE